MIIRIGYVQYRGITPVCVCGRGVGGDTLQHCNVAFLSGNFSNQNSIQEKINLNQQKKFFF